MLSACLNVKISPNVKKKTKGLTLCKKKYKLNFDKLFNVKKH